MEIRQIEYVVGVVEQGGFTRAADGPPRHATGAVRGDPPSRGRAGPSSCSTESGGGPLLSSAGEAFLEPARQLLRDSASCARSVAAVGGLTADAST